MVPLARGNQDFAHFTLALAALGAVGMAVTESGLVTIASILQLLLTCLFSMFSTFSVYLPRDLGSLIICCQHGISVGKGDKGLFPIHQEIFNIRLALILKSA